MPFVDLIPTSSSARIDSQIITRALQLWIPGGPASIRETSFSPLPQNEQWMMPSKSSTSSLLIHTSHTDAKKPLRITILISCYPTCFFLSIREGPFYVTNPFQFVRIEKKRTAVLVSGSPESSGRWKNYSSVFSSFFSSAFGSVLTAFAVRASTVFLPTMLSRMN